MSKINDFVIKNLNYCQETHSLVHRLFVMWKSKFPQSKIEAQEDAWKIIREMNEEEFDGN